MQGDTSKKQISLIFTGDEYREGLETIAQELQSRNIPGSFFVTGKFLEDRKARKILRKLYKAGHYVGPHSDAHLLYMPWEDREELLVSRREFANDLKENLRKLQELGVENMDKFVAPYEWYNRQIVEWSEDLGFRLFNFTPGLRTAADYTYPQMGDRYMSATAIINQLVRQEEHAGLNGYIILIHLGADERRPDKLFDQLDHMIDILTDKNYKFVSLDDI